MDPTKNFDHLDPKLKETYARVMGTPAGAPPAPVQPAAAPAAPTDPNQFNAVPAAPAAAPAGMPMGATSMLTQPSVAANPESAPPSSSFFSNPSPATTAPSQPAAADANLSAPFAPPAEQPQVPITPYSSPSEGAPQAVPAMGTADQFSQPLPSPASVVQNAPKPASALLRVLYIIAAVVFFAIYTVFWIKVFNLPFLF